MDTTPVLWTPLWSSDYVWMLYSMEVYVLCGHSGSQMRVYQGKKSLYSETFIRNTKSTV